eukprot:GHVT01104857.1.p2 GENE.GHVT01104857.1~~GHVT01104857.1.p2  ORF type:complete len:104 (-),score=1.82 GHVT01104857.1:325-636(-)
MRSFSPSESGDTLKFQAAPAQQPYAVDTHVQPGLEMLPKAPPNRVLWSNQYAESPANDFPGISQFRHPLPTFPPQHSISSSMKRPGSCCPTVHRTRISITAHL